MTIEKSRKLFFGCRIDSKLREALAQATPGNRRYFEDPTSEFLRICTFENERWIGKVMSPGLNVLEVEDVQRNIVSILRRIAPDIRHNPSNIKIFPLADAEPAPPVRDHDSGPYIG